MVARETGGAARLVRHAASGYKVEGVDHRRSRLTVTLARIAEARRAIGGAVLRTPTFPAPRLSELRRAGLRQRIR